MAFDSDTPLRVAVVGAGLGGLAVSAALRQQGHVVEVCFVYSAHSVFFRIIYLERFSKHRTRMQKMVLVLRFLQMERKPCNVLDTNEIISIR